MKQNRDRLCRSVSFRLSEADYARLAYQAATVNLRVNELARQRTLSGEKALVVETHQRYDPSWILQLIAVGNNLNQIAKRLHITGRVSPSLDALCRKISSIIDCAVEDDRGVQ